MLSSKSLVAVATELITEWVALLLWLTRVLPASYAAFRIITVRFGFSLRKSDLASNALLAVEPSVK